MSQAFGFICAALDKESYSLWPPASGYKLAVLQCIESKLRESYDDIKGCLKTPHSRRQSLVNTEDEKIKELLETTDKRMKDLNEVVALIEKNKAESEQARPSKQ